MPEWGCGGAVPDEALAAGVAGGDAAALDTLYRRYQLRTVNLVQRVTRDRALAQDLTQDAFTRVWLKAGGFEGRRFRGWLYTIALNLTRSELARRRRGPREAAPGVLEAAPSPIEGPYARLARLEEERRLARAVGKLPPLLRDVVVLKVYRELTYEEMAQVTGASAAVLKVRFHRAVARLRERLRRVPTPRPRTRPA
jgi:RNA polymerase sigma-70 factor, ECF subfamily